MATPRPPGSALTFDDPRVDGFAQSIWRHARAADPLGIPDFDADFVSVSLRKELEARPAGVKLLVLLTGLTIACAKSTNGYVIVENGLVPLLAQATRTSIGSHLMTTTAFLRFMCILIDSEPVLKALNGKDILRCFELYAAEDKTMLSYASVCDATRNIIVSLLSTKTGVARLLEVPRIYEYLAQLLNPIYIIDRSKNENKYSSMYSYMNSTESFRFVQQLSPLIFSSDDYMSPEKASLSSLRRYIVALCSLCMTCFKEDETSDTFRFAISLLHAGLVEKSIKIISDATNTVTLQDGTSFVDYSCITSGSLNSVLRSEKFYYVTEGTQPDRPGSVKAAIPLFLYETLCSCIFIGTFNTLFKNPEEGRDLSEKLKHLSPIALLWRAVGPVFAIIINNIGTSSDGRKPNTLQDIEGFAAKLEKSPISSICYLLIYHFFYFVNQVVNIYSKGLRELQNIREKYKEPGRLEEYLSILFGGLQYADIIGIVYSCYAIMNMQHRKQILKVNDQDNNSTFKISTRREANATLPLDLPESACIVLISFINCCTTFGQFKDWLNMCEVNARKEPLTKKRGTGTDAEIEEQRRHTQRLLVFLMQLIYGACNSNVFVPHLTAADQKNQFKSRDTTYSNTRDNTNGIDNGPGKGGHYDGRIGVINISNILNARIGVKWISAGWSSLGTGDTLHETMSRLKKSNDTLLYGTQYSTSIAKLITILTSFLEFGKKRDPSGQQRISGESHEEVPGSRKKINPIPPIDIMARFLKCYNNLKLERMKEIDESSHMKKTNQLIASNDYNPEPMPQSQTVYSSQQQQQQKQAIANQNIQNPVAFVNQTEGEDSNRMTEISVRSTIMLRKCLAKAIITNNNKIFHTIKNSIVDSEPLIGDIDLQTIERVITSDIMISECMLFMASGNELPNARSPIPEQAELNASYELALSFIMCYPPTYRELISKSLINMFKANPNEEDELAISRIPMNVQDLEMLEYKRYNTESDIEQQSLEGASSRPVLSVNLIRTMLGSSFVKKQAKNGTQKGEKPSEKGEEAEKQLGELQSVTNRAAVLTGMLATDELNDMDVEEVAFEKFVPFCIFAALALCRGDYINMGVQEHLLGQGANDSVRNKLQMQLKYNSALKVHFNFSTSGELTSALESSSYVEGAEHPGMSDIEIYKTRTLNYSSIKRGDNGNLITLKPLIDGILLSPITTILIRVNKKLNILQTANSEFEERDIATDKPIMSTIINHVNNFNLWKYRCDELFSFRTLCALALMGASVMYSDTLSDCTIPLLAGSSLGTMNQALVSRSISVKDVHSIKMLECINEILYGTVFNKWVSRANNCLNIIKNAGVLYTDMVNSNYDLWCPLWNHCFTRQALYYIVRFNTEAHFAVGSNSPLIGFRNYENTLTSKDQTRQKGESEPSMGEKPDKPRESKSPVDTFKYFFDVITNDNILEQCAFINKDYLQEVIAGRLFTQEILNKRMTQNMDFISTLESILIYLTYMKEYIDMNMALKQQQQRQQQQDQMQLIEPLTPLTPLRSSSEGFNKSTLPEDTKVILSTQVLVYVAYLFSEFAGLYGKRNNLTNISPQSQQSYNDLIMEYCLIHNIEKLTLDEKLKLEPALYDTIIPLSCTPTRLLFINAPRQTRDKVLALICDVLVACTTFHEVTDTQDISQFPLVGIGMNGGEGTPFIPSSVLGYNNQAYSLASMETMRRLKSAESSEVMKVITFIMSTFRRSGTSGEQDRVQAENTTPVENTEKQTNRTENDGNIMEKNVFSGGLVPTIFETLLYLLSGSELVPVDCQSAKGTSHTEVSPETYSKLVRLFCNTSIHSHHCVRVMEIASTSIPMLHSILGMKFEQQTLSIPKEAASVLLVNNVLGGILPLLPDLLTNKVALEDPEDPIMIIPQRVRIANNKKSAETILDLLATAHHNISISIMGKIKEDRITNAKFEDKMKHSKNGRSEFAFGDNDSSGITYTPEETIELNKMIMYMKLISLNDIVSACVRTSNMHHSMKVAFQIIRDLVQANVGQDMIIGGLDEVASYISMQFEELKAPDIATLECSSVLASLARSQTTRAPLLINYCGIRKRPQEGVEQNVDLLADSVQLLAKMRSCPASLLINMLLFFESVFIFDRAAQKFEAEIVYRLVSLNLHMVLLRKIARGPFAYGMNADDSASMSVANTSTAGGRRITQQIATADMNPVEVRVMHGIEDIMIRILFLISTYSPEIHNLVLSANPAQYLGKYIIRSKNPMYEKPLSCIVQPDYRKDRFLSVGKEVWNI